MQVTEQMDSPASSSKFRSDVAITYASFANDKVTGAHGGWRVGQRLSADAEGLSEDQVHKVLEMIPSQLLSDESIPPYASEEQQQRFVRRTAWLPSPWSSNDNVLLHSAPAGKDSSGRTGNIFTVAHVFKDGTRGLPGRPAQMLRSADLPAPFGAPEVTAVQLDSTELALNARINPQRVFAELMNPAAPDQGPLLDVLCVVLDALNNSGHVIIGDDHHRAWLWIAAVNFATHPEQAAKIHWSTYERASTVAEQRKQGASLVIVPRSDIDEIRDQHPNATVIDAVQGVKRGTWGVQGAPSEIVGIPGGEVEVSAWSELLRYLVTTAGATAALARPQFHNGGYAELVASLSLRNLPEAFEEVGGPLKQAIADARRRGQYKRPSDLIAQVDDLPEQDQTQLRTEPEKEKFSPLPPDEDLFQNPFDSDDGPLSGVGPGLPEGCIEAYIRDIPEQQSERLEQAINKFGPEWVNRGGTEMDNWADTIELLLADTRDGRDDLRKIQLLVYASALAAVALHFKQQHVHVRLLPWWRTELMSEAERNTVRDSAWSFVTEDLQRRQQTQGAEYFERLRGVRENLGKVEHTDKLPTGLKREAKALDQRVAQEYQRAFSSLTPTSTQSKPKRGWKTT